MSDSLSSAPSSVRTLKRSSLCSAVLKSRGPSPVLVVVRAFSPFSLSHPSLIRRFVERRQVDLSYRENENYKSNTKTSCSVQYVYSYTVTLTRDFLPAHAQPLNADERRAGDGRTIHTYNYAKMPRCTASAGLAQARPNKGPWR